MYIAQLVFEIEVLMKYKKIEIHLDDPIIHMISFSFKKNHFKHLIGFHYTKFRNTPSESIYKKCKKGLFNLGLDNKLNVFDKKHEKYKEMTGSGVNKLIEKIKNSKMINIILCDPNHNDLVDFDKTLVVGDTEQGSEYILHLEKGNVRYHLGLKKDLILNEYVPVSFFFEKDHKMNKFIEGQKQIKIKKISRIT